jgi:hypothetical protein
METDKIGFYLSHRRQISEWAKLAERVDKLMRDAVKEGSQDKAIKLLNAQSGDAEADFYVRNRWLITEWDTLQSLAGQALHAELLASAREAGFDADERKRGWTEVTFRSPEFDRLRDDQRVWVHLAWTKQDLLSTRRGYPSPRLSLVLHPETWNGVSRDMVAEATRPVAHELGMKKKLVWSAHWGPLDEIAESQSLQSYADACVARLRDASARLYPVLVEAIAATHTRS